MPKSWSSKDERKYDRIKKSAERRDVAEERAEEIAARTVNRDRRLEGRARSTRTQGTGNPYAGLEERTVEQLRNRAAELGIEGRSRMTKRELIAAIRARQ